MSIDILPVELQLEIASYLQLRELILLRNASRHWQVLINNNLSFLRRARRELLRLWDDTIHSPYFLPSRSRVLPVLRPFDRVRYLRSLSCGPALPEEFELWVLEWPAKAVIGWTWPGLDGGLYAYTDSGCFCYSGPPPTPPLHAWWQLHGTNALRASFANDSAESVFTLPETTVRAGYEGYWLERRGGGGAPVVGELAAAGGLAVPVWALDGGGGHHSPSRSVAHMLVVRDGPAGGKCDGIVLPFNIRVRSDRRNGSFHRFARTPCVECECGRCPWYKWIWWKAEVGQSVRAASWTEWLRCCLRALEANYLFHWAASWTEWLRCCLRALEANYLFHWAASEDEAYWTMVDGWEEFVFREIDLEHFPKSCEIDGVSYRLGDLGGGSERFHELFEPELRAS